MLIILFWKDPWNFARLAMDKIDSIIETLKLAFKTEITKKTTEIEQ